MWLLNGWNINRSKIIFLRQTIENIWEMVTTDTINSLYIYICQERYSLGKTIFLYARKKRNVHFLHDGWKNFLRSFGKVWAPLKVFRSKTRGKWLWLLMARESSGINNNFNFAARMAKVSVFSQTWDYIDLVAREYSIPTFHENVISFAFTYLAAKPPAKIKQSKEIHNVHRLFVISTDKKNNLTRLDQFVMKRTFVLDIRWTFVLTILFLFLVYLYFKVISTKHVILMIITMFVSSRNPMVRKCRVLSVDLKY